MLVPEAVGGGVMVLVAVPADSEWVLIWVFVIEVVSIAVLVLDSVGSRVGVTSAHTKGSHSLSMVVLVGWIGISVPLGAVAVATDPPVMQTVEPVKSPKR